MDRHDRIAARMRSHPLLPADPLSPDESYMRVLWLSEWPRAFNPCELKRTVDSHGPTTERILSAMDGHFLGEGRSGRSLSTACV